MLARRIIYGCDHNAEFQKSILKKYLEGIGEVIDINNEKPLMDNYVDISIEVCRYVCINVSTGIIVCGTGIGGSIIANKHRGILAARCVTPNDAKDSRLTNNANILCLSAKIAPELNIEIIQTFYETEFIPSVKRLEREDQIKQLEKHNFL